MSGKINKLKLSFLLQQAIEFDETYNIDFFETKTYKLTSHDLNSWTKLIKVFIWNNICKIAAWFGDLQCLEWAHRKKFYWDEETFENAVINGNLFCVKWLHEHHCPVGVRACEYAAASGQLHCLQWMLENGWDFNIQIYNEAENMRQYHIVDWLDDEFSIIL